MSASDLEEFQTGFAQLQEGSDKNFDPVHFAYLGGLSLRLEQPQYAQNSHLLSRAQLSLREYIVNLTQRREQIQSLLDDVVNSFPEYQQQAHALFEQCQFEKLERLLLKLKNDSDAEQVLEPLIVLTKDINRDSQSNNQKQMALSLDQQLDQQEQELLSAAGYNVLIEKDGSGEQLELQSMKKFRESMKYVNVDKIIAQAINDCPENPGPHNPQMLAVRSLTIMRELSPQYLRRFTSYIETMLFLEKSEAKLSSKKAFR